MKRKYLFTLVLSSLVLFSACNDENDIATPQAQVGLKFVTMTASAPINGGMGSADRLAFTSGSIVLSEVSFEGKSDVDSLRVKFELERDVTIDFATGATSPNIGAVGFKPGTYKETEVELELQDKGTMPAIVLNGTFTDAGGQAHPIRFEFNSGETFEVEKKGTIVFAEGKSAVAEVTFNPVSWFAGVSSEQLSAATKNAQGVIVISSTQNRGIFDEVADGLDLATEVEIKH